MSTSGASARYTQGRYTQHLDKFDNDIVMSEKKAIPQARGGLRFTALLPVVFMAIAFVLTLLATLSGTKIGMMENCHVMTLNTTSLGQNLVEFKPATSKRDLENLLDERDPSLLNPFAASTATTTASGTAATATSTATGPFAAIGSVFNGFVNNITASIDGDLTNAEAALVAAVTKDLGVAEYYTFHMSSLCKGNLSSPSDPNAQFQPTSCESYTNASSGLSNLTSGIPSSLKIATTNITVPALAELSNSGSFLEGASKLLTNAVFAFFILSLIGSAITFLLSFVSIFLRGNRFIVYGNIFFSTIAFIFQLAASISVTIIAAGTSTIVNSFGNTVGLSSTMGMRFQALIWVSFVLILIAQEYWLAIWFVEFRRRSYKARSRTPNEIGNWLGILKEVLSDLRLKEEEPGSWSSRMEIGQPQPIRTRSYAMI